ncbi:MAG TPA: stage II sporulation protein M [Burkholderiaceae bacterium]|jgi:uncharacterized membrane protein SpoIIM required for sporulation|nr:stage II sporulation protein M [Burkholderiaceae bacterium]
MSDLQDAWVADRRGDWNELTALMGQYRSWHRLPPATIARAGGLYRSISADLMHARSAGYTPDLVAYLDGLAGRAHAGLYSAPPYRLGAIVELVTHEFPRTVRRYWKFVLIAAVLMTGPGLVGFVGSMRSQSFATQILPEATAAQMRESYSHDPSEGRTGNDNAFMAGFYVNNNIGIAFRCFATGILFGLGSLFFLVYNGLTIGAVAGFVQSAGYGRNLLTFMVGHGAFELTAIVISGAAGMVMGYALVDTGGLTRFGSLRRRARDLAQLIMGVAVMLAIAACLEGFWSPAHVPRTAKLVAAALLWVSVMAYLALAGRSRRRSS